MVNSNFRGHLRQNGDGAAARISSLETGYENLRKGLDRLEGEIGQGFARVFQLIDNMRTDLGSSQKTNWPLLIGVASIFLPVGFAVIGAVMYVVNDTRATTSQQAAVILELARNQSAIVAQVGTANTLAAQTLETVRRQDARLDTLAEESAYQRGRLQTLCAGLLRGSC